MAELTVKEMFDRVSGEMTKVNAEVMNILNTYGNNMYHLGCIAGEETVRNSLSKSQLEKVVKAMFLDCNKGTTKLTIIEYAGEGTTVVYSGYACDVPDSLYDKPYTVLNITTAYDDQRGVYIPDGMKTITVV